MDTIEKIKRYIDLTKHPYNSRYDMLTSEWIFLARYGNTLEAIDLAFSYGRSKGYREAKAK